VLQPPPGPGFGGAEGLSARPIRVPVGAIGLGAPLFDAAGDVFGDVRITIPAGRFDPTLEPKLDVLLVSVAADISADLRDSGFIRDA
jgi:DNA-binding IclR family transcriptional regulator